MTGKLLARTSVASSALVSLSKILHGAIAVFALSLVVSSLSLFLFRVQDRLDKMCVLFENSEHGKVKRFSCCRFSNSFFALTFAANAAGFARDTLLHRKRKLTSTLCAAISP